MVRVDLKGVAKVTSKAGRAYYYAWRGGPRLEGEPGSPEFLASYNAAHQGRHQSDDGTLRSLIAAYKAGPYAKLAESTRRNYAAWLDRIGAYFGRLSLAQFDRPERIRSVIIKWRGKYLDHPRTADYAVQVLSSVLRYGVKGVGKLRVNACHGIERTYEGDRSDIIWTDADIARLNASCSPEITWAVDLAAHTGLRRGDLLRLSWSHVGEDAITIRTGKSRGKREVVIPLYDGLRDALARVPKRATTILTSGRGRPWQGFTSSFRQAVAKAGMGGLDLHFHDLRGTAITRFYVAGIPIRVIAEVVGWTEENVEKIIRKYVGRSAATQAFIRQMRAEKGTSATKTPAKNRGR